MLDHISIAVTDLGRSQVFYDAVLEPLGYVRIFESNNACGYAPRGQTDEPFAIRRNASAVKPPHTMHIAFAASSRDAVVAFYEAALRLGAISAGKPELQQEYGDGYFAAFVLDPDGYRIEAVLHE